MKKILLIASLMVIFDIASGSQQGLQLQDSRYLQLPQINAQGCKVQLFSPVYRGEGPSRTPYKNDVYNGWCREMASYTDGSNTLLVRAIDARDARERSSGEIKENWQCAFVGGVTSKLMEIVRQIFIADSMIGKSRKMDIVVDYSTDNYEDYFVPKTPTSNVGSLTRALQALFGDISIEYANINSKCFEELLLDLNQKCHLESCKEMMFYRSNLLLDEETEVFAKFDFKKLPSTISVVFSRITLEVYGWLLSIMERCPSVTKLEFLDNCVNAIGYESKTFFKYDDGEIIIKTLLVPYDDMRSESEYVKDDPIYGRGYDHAQYTIEGSDAIIIHRRLSNKEPAELLICRNALTTPTALNKISQLVTKDSRNGVCDIYLDYRTQAGGRGAIPGSDIEKILLLISKLGKVTICGANMDSKCLEALGKYHSSWGGIIKYVNCDFSRCRR